MKKYTFLISILFISLGSKSFAKPSGESNFLTNCQIAGLGYSDNSYATEFDIFQNNSDPETGYAVVKKLLITKMGEELITKRTIKHYQLKIKVNKSKEPMTVLTFPEDSFNDDYLSISLPQKMERFSQTYPISWGAHKYYCSAVY